MNGIDMKVVTATPEQQALAFEMVKWLKERAPIITGPELIALVANVLGKIIAYQDEGNMSGPLATVIVLENMAAGNAQAIEAARADKATHVVGTGGFNGA